MQCGVLQVFFSHNFWHKLKCRLIRIMSYTAIDYEVKICADFGSYWFYTIENSGIFAIVCSFVVIKTY